MSHNNSIGNYLIQRLLKLGVNHVFGVPGDFVLGFNKLLENSDIEFINTCDEQGAGFAADAYARLRGLGVVCVTYCVGGLKIANTTAQCFAEKSPVVVISGSPGINERIKNPLLHHKVKEFDTQYKVFQEITVASTVLDNPDTAKSEIERVLTAALRYKRPVYIEIPRDIVHFKLNESAEKKPSKKTELNNSTTSLNTHLNPSIIANSSNSYALKEALEEAVKLINKAEHPVILAGVEIHRFKLQDALLKLVEKTNLPVAETLLGKSVINEMYRPQLPQEYTVKTGAKITIKRLFERLNLFLTNDMIVIADVGDALFAGADLLVHKKSRFLSPAYYASLGFAIPASIGAQKANPNIRPLVLVGDGAFQMTGMELSTIVRYGLNPIIVVLNNLGYGTERPMQDGKFNDILLWNYSQLPTIFNAGKGFNIRTEDELEIALKESESYTDSFCLLDVHLEPSDTSLALKRLTKALGEKV